jgi:Asp-tRNA(Asn)/Glu-tRNA(Gln) amidotransferase C subunit
MAKASSQKEQLDDLDGQIEEIRRRFDMYFQGSKEQRTPPQTAQAQVGGVLRRLREDDSHTWNTQDRFRLNQIHARFISMERMWARGMQKVEAGTSKRDKLKLELRNKKASPPPKTQARPGLDDDLPGFDVDFSENSVTAPKPLATSQTPQPRAPAAPPRESGVSGMSEQRLQQLYQIYMQAKKNTGESSSLTLDGLRGQLAKQMPVLQQKHSGKGIDFKVVLKDGKAMLKAVPK